MTVEATNKATEYGVQFYMPRLGGFLGYPEALKIGMYV